jgi:dihydroxyacid dehydratase/phosphogluconate dehydratase
MRREARRRRDPHLRQAAREDAGFIVLRGNLFDSAIMKTSVISKEFRDRYLSNPKDPEAFEGRAIVFDGPEDYHSSASTMNRSISTSTACCSCAVSARSAIRAARRS